MSDWALQAYKQMIETGNDWAEKDGAYGVLDDSNKSILAQCKMQSEAKSDAAKETEARASETYTAFLVTLGKAREAKTLAKVKYDAIKALGSFRQTQQSLEKAKFNAEANLT
jgi:hypothetical protein